MKKSVVLSLAVCVMLAALAGCAGTKKLSPEELVMQKTQAFVSDVLAAKADAEPVVMWRGCAQIPPWITENVREQGHKDNDLQWVRLDRPSGSAKAYIINFACHPEVMWSRNTLLSSDFPGVLCRLVEEQTGATPLFIQGALGGMVTPNMEEGAGIEDRVRFLKTMGGVLFDRLMESSKDGVKVREPRVSHSARRITVPLENRMLYVLHRLGVLKRGGGRTVETEVNLVRVGDTAILGVPGEPLPAVGDMIRARLAGAVQVFVAGLCCDELGYILAPEQSGLEKYAFERSMSAGPSLADELLRSVYMLDKMA